MLLDRGARGDEVGQQRAHRRQQRQHLWIGRRAARMRRTRARPAPGLPPIAGQATAPRSPHASAARRAREVRIGQDVLDPDGLAARPRPARQPLVAREAQRAARALEQRLRRCPRRATCRSGAARSRARRLSRRRPASSRTRAATVFSTPCSPSFSEAASASALLDRVAQLELVLRALARGDVEHHALQHRRAPVLVVHDRGLVPEPHRLARPGRSSGTRSRAARQSPCCAPRRPAPVRGRPGAGARTRPPGSRSIPRPSSQGSDSIFGLT